jgi:tRNA (cytidine/uridine-2'-O-)-methyltransferase
MLDIVLYEPEIPPNTGNIMRLCRNTGFKLHLIEPLGFDLDSKKLLRARLDYNEYYSTKVYSDWTEYKKLNIEKKIYGFSTKGKTCFSDAAYEPGNALLFGPETRGLPEQIFQEIGVENILKIPMISDSRSLNLSNAAAIVVYEAWRQLAYINGIL